MEYSKLVAVAGLPGLFELINSKSDGAIVRSLDDKTSRFISGRVHNFSHLESIEVFTTGENVNLAEVLLAMQSSKEKLPEEKDAAAVRKYFEKVYPELDFERVYHSDLKKMIRWAAVLQHHNIEIKLPEEEQPEDESQVEAEVAEEAKEGSGKTKSKAAKKEEPEESSKKKAAGKKK
jgi:hypothetical protein